MQNRGSDGSSCRPGSWRPPIASSAGASAARFNRPILIHAARVAARAGGLDFVPDRRLRRDSPRRLAHFAHVDALTAYLATSPGGADSVAIIAASTKVDMPFIMAMQMARFLRRPVRRTGDRPLCRLARRAVSGLGRRGPSAPARASDRWPSPGARTFVERFRGGDEKFTAFKSLRLTGCCSTGAPSAADAGAIDSVSPGGQGAAAPVPTVEPPPAPGDVTIPLVAPVLSSWANLLASIAQLSGAASR